jgi:ferredoxin-like protein FixX
MHPSSRIPPTHNPHRLTPSPSPDTHPRRDTLLGFQAALTSAPAPEVDRVLATSFGDDGEIAPGTLDTLLERSCAALHKLKVTGSNPRGGGGGDDPDTWTRAINATTMCQHALSRANHGSTLPFLCGIQQDSNHSLIHSSSPDDASPATPKNSDGQKETNPKPAVYRFMAAVCQTLVSIDHEDEPSRYAVKVACVRCLQSIAAARVIAHTQSQSEGYHYPAGGVGINTRETTEGTGEGEDVDSFGLFDVLMDALDLASSEVITSDLYGKVSLFLILFNREIGPTARVFCAQVSTELLRLWCTRPRRPAASRHVMHDPVVSLL